MSKLACAALLATTVLAACASRAPPEGSVASAAAARQVLLPGQASKAAVLAALGPTRSVTFDSGYEAWLYLEPAGAGRYAELVLLFDRAGILRKVRRRAPEPATPG